jgi:hypothetical protein
MCHIVGPERLRPVAMIFLKCLQLIDKEASASAHASALDYHHEPMFMQKGGVQEAIHWSSLAVRRALHATYMNYDRLPWCPMAYYVSCLQWLLDGAASQAGSG